MPQKLSSLIAKSTCDCKCFYFESGNYLSSRAVRPSTLGVRELNFCVRDGNRWILSAIVTGMVYKRPFGRIYQVSLKVSPFNDYHQNLFLNRSRDPDQGASKTMLLRRTPQFAHTCASCSSEETRPAGGLLRDAFGFLPVKSFSQKRISRNFRRLTTACKKVLGFKKGKISSSLKS